MDICIYAYIYILFLLLCINVSLQESILPFLAQFRFVFGTFTEMEPLLCTAPTATRPEAEACRRQLR